MTNPETSPPQDPEDELCREYTKNDICYDCYPICPYEATEGPDAWEKCYDIHMGIE